jgi:uncharacterized coiled-coil DUF342 family protein
MGIDIYNILSTALTLFFGGGWFIYYRSNKRIKEGEATQSEAEGWLKQQQAYHNTIDELTSHCEFIKQDRNLLREENTQLRKENDELRKTVNELQDTVLNLKKEVSRLGRKVAAIQSDEKEDKKKEVKKKTKTK